LSDFEQPTENKVSEIQVLSNSVLVNNWEILVILFFNIGVALGKVEREPKLHHKSKRVQ
jgi:hypothetical protein